MCAQVEAVIEPLRTACAGSLDVLCLNSGIMASPDVTTADGFNKEIQVIDRPATGEEHKRSIQFETSSVLTSRTDRLAARVASRSTCSRTHSF